MQNQQAWDEELEKEFKSTIHNYFDEKINNALQEGNALQIGDNLGQLLKDSESDIVKIITPPCSEEVSKPRNFALMRRVFE